MATTKYRLTANRFRQLDLDKSGRVVGGTRYRRGDVITDLPDSQVQRLLAIGAIVKVGEDDPDLEAGTTQTDGTGSGAASGVPAGGSDEGTTPSGDPTVPAADVPGQYDGLEYSALQSLAKQRTGNGGGSREDLIARLEQHDKDTA